MSSKVRPKKKKTTKQYIINKISQNARELHKNTRVYQKQGALIKHTHTHTHTHTQPTNQPKLSKPHLHTEKVKTNTYHTNRQSMQRLVGDQATECREQPVTHV
jgi:hypothetical protein